MHTEYALARYHDGTGEKAAGWHIQTSAISADYQTAYRHLKCAQAGVLSKQRLGACLDQKELKIMARWVTDWNAEGRPVVIAGPGYIRKEDLPNPDLQGSGCPDREMRPGEGIRSYVSLQAPNRNAAAQQDPGDTCPHCGMPARTLRSHRGWRIRVCDHCGPLMPKPVHRETRKSNDGLLLFLGGVALMALLGCAVCTAVVCRVMHEARQVETQQER